MRFFRIAGWPMGKFDKARIENWKPYALLTLAAGTVASIGTILGFGSTAYDWCCDTRPPTFVGIVNGLGGYADQSNREFKNFLMENIGETVVLDIEIYVYGPADLTPSETTCTSSNAPNAAAVDPGIANPSQYAWMDNEEMEKLYTLPSLEGRLLGFQENRQDGDSFIITHGIVPCQSVVVSGPADYIKFNSGGPHGMNASLEGTFRIAYDMNGFDDIVPHVILTSSQ